MNPSDNQPMVASVKHFTIFPRLSPAILFFGLWVVSFLSPSTHADGNPDFVGVLAIITEPQASADLGLNDDQLEKLRALIKQHEAKALEIASQVRNLEPAERREKTNQILRDLEKQGMALLSQPQQIKAEQLRLRNLGLSAIMDAEVASSLGITEAQAAKARTVAEGRRNLFREMGMERGKAEFNRRLDEILDDSQRSKWTEMIGKPVQAVAASSEPAANADRDTSVVASPSDIPVVMSGTRAEGLRLSFNSTPWNTVLKWLAKEAELSLQTDFYPAGTFTYIDPYKLYSVPEAMDVMNYILISRGYTLIRKDRALMCVDLDPANGGGPTMVRALVRELSELVTPEGLDQRGEYEVCKCAFPLQRISVEDAEKEFSPTLSPHGSIITQLLANQILVTECAGKLRFIRDTIARAETPEAGRASKVVVVQLQHVSADEVLGIARPLIGLKELSNTSEDLNISTDAFGRTIFATGSTDKLQRLKDIVAQIDVEPSDDVAKATTAEQPVVRAHPITGSDPQLTMDILQTQFSGQTNMHLALDPKTNNIIASATPSDHEKIQELIAVISGESSVFEIIQLEKLDTQAAILTLEKFYGKQSSKDKDPANAKGPVFYGDTGTRRIMVRGSKNEVEQVKQLLTKVEKSGPPTNEIEGNVLVLPYQGRAAERMLDQVDLLWKVSKHKEPIRRILPKNQGNKRAPGDSRRTQDKSQASMEIDAGSPYGDTSAVKLASQVGQDPQSSDQTEGSDTTVMSKDGVTVYQGPSGLVITSEDRELLKEFNKYAEVARGQIANGPSEPTVIYLQYIGATAAEELIRGVLSGSSSSSGGGGGLLGDVASNMFGGGLLGGLLGGMGGGGSSSSNSPITSPTASGDVYIMADPRLNALWVQANSIDMQMIESLVEIIDTPNSPVEIQTRGAPEIIYLQTALVADVEATVKQVFADRLSQASSGGGGAAAAQRQPSPQEFIEALRGGGGGGNRRNGPKELKEQTMTVTADKKNNALIVVAQPQLVAEVKELVEMLDQAAEGSEQNIIVLPLGGDVNATTIQSALSSLFGSQARTSSTSNQNQNNNRPANNPTGAPSAANPMPQGNPFGAFQNRGAFPAGAFQAMPGGFGGPGGGMGRMGGGGMNGGGFNPGGFGGGGFGGNRGGGGGNRGGGGGNRGR